MSTHSYIPVSPAIHLVSIRGETGCTETGSEISSGPNAVAIINGIYPGQENCFSVSLPESTLSIFLSRDELDDAEQYRISEPDRQRLRDLLGDPAPAQTNASVRNTTRPRG